MWLWAITAVGVVLTAAAVEMMTTNCGTASLAKHRMAYCQ
jgi:hypothetical protein